jgi:hypothetical protein
MIQSVFFHGITNDNKIKFTLCNNCHNHIFYRFFSALLFSISLPFSSETTIRKSFSFILLFALLCDELRGLRTYRKHKRNSIQPVNKSSFRESLGIFILSPRSWQKNIFLFSHTLSNDYNSLVDVAKNVFPPFRLDSYPHTIE